MFISVVPHKEYVTSTKETCRLGTLRRSAKSSSFLICTFYFLSIHAGTNRHSNICTHCVHRFVYHTHSQRSQATVPHWSCVHSVGVFDIHSIRVPEKEVIDSR